jgi:NhaP-type Na+/H+ or K+/H+ antiporter
MTESTDLLAVPYSLILLGLGVLMALVAWLPLALRRLPLSLPIICIGLGAALFVLWPGKIVPLPTAYPEIAERFCEFVVIVALMGAGLKIDRPFSFARWRITWRLLLITMPLSIVGIMLIGHWMAGLPIAVALLLGATLAPTDPVLASDIQLGPPKSGEDDEVRFGLTSEAGLNDGLAFPFVHLAILLAGAAGMAGEDVLIHWLGFSVLWKIGAGVVIGWLAGVAFGWATFRLPRASKLANTGDGLIAIAATFVSYGLAEAVLGYGFISVFVAALAFRHAHRQHDFHRDMHDFTEQIERLAMMALLLLFGGAIVNGLLDPLHWADIAFALVVLVVIRPVAGLLGLAGLPASRGERLTLAFFGIRGVGSFYYLAYGLNHAELESPDRLWAIVGLIVLLSVLMHGLSVTPVMRWLDRDRGRDPDAGSPEPERAA